MNFRHAFFWPTRYYLHIVKTDFSAVVYDSCEIYFIKEPSNLIPKKMHTFLGPKIYKKLA